MNLHAHLRMMLLCALIGTLLGGTLAGQQALVLQSDFGSKDGAVAAMKGVAVGVSSALSVYDLTHEIPAYNIWEAAYRLEQTAGYWPSGTVFVSVVDPGVGTTRKSVVLKTNTGHFFVTPDNGTLTLVAASMGIAAVREIDEAVNRRKDSEKSYTFHGRDVYAYTGARLAAGVIEFADVGQMLPAAVVSLPYQAPLISEDKLKGTIPILDVQYGNVWTNIPRDMFLALGITPGEMLNVKIHFGKNLKFEGAIPYANTFGEVAVGAPLIYLNSLNNVAIALNQASFAEKHQIASGAEWHITLEKKAE